MEIRFQKENGHLHIQGMAPRAFSTRRQLCCSCCRRGLPLAGLPHCIVPFCRGSPKDTRNCRARRREGTEKALLYETPHRVLQIKPIFAGVSGKLTCLKDRSRGLLEFSASMRKMDRHRTSKQFPSVSAEFPNFRAMT